jgi:3-oxoacyl-[acyl-carrier protein] reductase
MPGLAVVTGGARGIGLGIVQALLRDGVVDEVAVLDREPADIAEAKVYECDVTNEAAVAAAMAAIGTVPRVLVNNAGGERIRPDGFPFDPFGPVDHWRDTVDLNLTSAYIVTREIAPKMEAGAAICNTASIAGLFANPLFAYGAAKAALLHWTKSMAGVLAPRGIRMNAVAPGFVFTQLWAGLADKGTFDQMVQNTVPLGTEQTTEDIANAVSFLCSARASQITGEVIAIDGGTVAGLGLRRS